MIRSGDIFTRLFRLNVQDWGVVMRAKGEGVIRVALSHRPMYRRLDFDFPLVGVLLNEMPHIPTQRGQKLVNEIAADLSSR